MKLWILALAYVGLLVPACQEKKERGASAAISAEEQCYQRGMGYRWENGMCVNTGDAQSQCYAQPGYTWQNGMCVPNTQNNYNQGPMNTGYASCRQQTSFVGILQCIQQSTQTFRNLLNTPGQQINNLSDAIDDIETFSKKTSALMAQGLTSDMEGMKKLKACWDTTSMINQLRQMSNKLQFSDNNMLVQAQAFIDGMHGATREMQDRINCPLKF